MQTVTHTADYVIKTVQYKTINLPMKKCSMQVGWLGD